MNIKDLIFIIRDKQVILDSDVAQLYNYETKRINETVRRNIRRFPEDFCLQLTKEEYEELLKRKGNRLLTNWSQIVTFNKHDNKESSRSQFATLDEKENKRGSNLKYLPYVFTEQGIAMLSGLLRNDIAISVSINIMKAFVEMRKFITNNSNVLSRLTTVEYKLLEQDKRIDEVFDLFQKEPNLKSKIFFNGQIYDAHSILIDIIKEAKEKIIIIDNYIDKTLLDLLSNKENNVNILIITSSSNKLTSLDIAKFNEQYPFLKIEYSNDYHDRFIIIDNHITYHCGASLKDLGRRHLPLIKWRMVL